MLKHRKGVYDNHNIMIRGNFTMGPINENYICINAGHLKHLKAVLEQTLKGSSWKISRGFPNWDGIDPVWRWDTFWPFLTSSFGKPVLNRGFKKIIDISNIENALLFNNLCWKIFQNIFCLHVLNYSSDINIYLSSPLLFFFITERQMQFSYFKEEM